MPKSNGLYQVVKRLYQLLERRQKQAFVVIMLIMIVSAVLSQFTPLGIGMLTDHVLDTPLQSFWEVVPFLLFILLVNVANQVIMVVRRLMVEDTSTRTEKQARLMAVEALLKAPLSYFRQNMTGNIHGRLNRGLEGVGNLVKLLFMDFAPSITTAIAAVVVIFMKLPVVLALISILVIPIGMAIVIRQIAAQKGIRVHLLENKAAMDGTMVELLNGIETIRACDSVETECSRFEVQSEDLRVREMRHHKAMAFYDCIKFVNEAVFHVILIGASVYLASKGQISVGTVLTAYLCFTQLTTPLRELHRILDELSESMVLANDYFQLLYLPLDFSYRTILQEKDNDEICRVDQSVWMQGVTFRYPENLEKEVLSHFELSVAQGEFIGIAGPSGCGKSSLIKVLLKMEQADGVIKLHGRSMESITRKELAELIALVPQTPFLIAGTVRENLCYGLSHTPSESEIREAAERACILADIEAMPGGLDCEIAEGGGNLSGGQRQRMAIARVFLRRPQIIILDEATSALDNTSEHYIQEEIERIAASMHITVISIAHRLTTLQNCDRILVFRDGRIIQEGNFHALAQEPGVFQDMLKGTLKL